MPSKRDDFSAAVIRLLRDRVNGQCSNPGCERSTVGPSNEHADKSVVTGRACHIRAASEGGPRYDKDQSPEERSSIENGIWLCGACADLVDKNEGIDYPVNKLLAWKRNSETQAHKAQVEPARIVESRWDGQFAGIHYINVPRIAMWASGSGHSLNLEYLAGISNLHDLGIGINRLLIDLERVLRGLSLPAVSIENLCRLDEDFTGATASFERKFYTKNAPELPGQGPATTVQSDWTKSPHIHCKINPWRVVAVYDPKWVTTTTAYVEFRGGSRRFKGVGVVKEVNREDRIVFVTPIVIGIPKPEFEW